MKVVSFEKSDQAISFIRNQKNLRKRADDITVAPLNDGSGPFVEGNLGLIEDPALNDSLP